MTDSIASGNIAWIEEPPARIEESSPESAATVVETTFYPRIVAPAAERDQDEATDIASVSEYSGDVNVSADVSFEPFIPKPRDPWGGNASTASDPARVDDLQSTTSTLLTAATEEPRVNNEEEEQSKAKTNDVTIEVQRFGLPPSDFRNVTADINLGDDRMSDSARSSQFDVESIQGNGEQLEQNVVDSTPIKEEKDIPQTEESRSPLSGSSEPTTQIQASVRSEDVRDSSAAEIPSKDESSEQKAPDFTETLALPTAPAEEAKEKPSPEQPSEQRAEQSPSSQPTAAPASDEDVQKAPVESVEKKEEVVRRPTVTFSAETKSGEPKPREPKEDARTSTPATPPTARVESQQQQEATPQPAIQPPSALPEGAWITEPSVEEPPAKAAPAAQPELHEEKPAAKPEEAPPVETKAEDGPKKEQAPMNQAEAPAEEPQRTIADEDRDLNIDLDEYERKMIQNTREALALVDKLCQESVEEQKERRRRASGDQTANRVTIEGSLDLEVDSFRVNPELLEEPRSCVLLPDAKLLILDLKLGLTLLDLQSKEVKRCAPADDWRDVECACYMQKHNQILLVYEQKVNGNFEKYLGKFDLDLNMLSKCEAPKYIKEMVVTNCRVCYVEETDCIYLAVNTPNSCFIYELNEKCRWTEVYNMRGKTVVDIVKLAIVGPITELLIVEATKRHVYLLGIYESALAERAMLAFCAEPAAMCVDEQQNLIVFDRATNIVGVHSRLDFQRDRDLTIVGRANCSLSARGGYLALLNQAVKELRICKY